MPEQSKIDGFILNWQAKLFRSGIASCHCSKFGQSPIFQVILKVHRKLLKSQLFERMCREVECFAPFFAAIGDAAMAAKQVHSFVKRLIWLKLLAKVMLSGTVAVRFAEILQVITGNWQVASRRFKVKQQLCGAGQ
ncbi:hypothetical protein [Ensifer canadensis]